MGKKEDIFEATLDLVVARGLQNTPMSSIAESAGVGMGTVYNYFPSKQELINALYVKLKEDEARFMVNKCPAGLTLRQRFFFFWKNLLQYFITHPKEFQFLEQLSFSPDILEESKKQGAMYFAELIKVYEEGQRQEVLKKGDVFQQIFFTHGSMASLAKYRIQGDIDLDEEQIDEMITAAWDALKR